jgi:PAS domain S-box-containing protein
VADLDTDDLRARILHPEDVETSEDRKQAMARGMPFEVEQRLRHKEGKYRWFLIRYKPLKDAEGRVVRWYGGATDIEARKQAEQAPHRSEAYLAEAQRLTHTGSFVWDPIALRWSHWSEEMFRIFGFDPQDGIPTNIDLAKRIHPEDMEYVMSAVRQKIDYIMNHRIILPDGTVRHIESTGHPVLDSSGEQVELVGASMDITARKHAEEELHAAETRFRASVDHLTDALFIHDDQDVQRRIVDVNQQACKSLGYSREELIGMTAFDYDPLVDQAVMLSIKERLTRGDVFSFENAHRRKDGTVFPVEVRLRPFWHGDHRFGLAVARDITDRKRSEQESERLQQLEAHLAHLNRVSMMGELAASLAHEIKQPIAAVATNAKTGLRWLQREPPNAGEARQALSRIVNDAERAADIIDRNRSLYQQDRLKRETVNLNQVVREIIVLLQDPANRQSVSIRAELDGDVPTMSADRVQIQQVLMNLMLNGIEAMKDTGGELTIRSKRSEDRQVLLSVSDMGCGLPRENADRVFDAFFTTKAQGTGMGLSICRRIVESHGGRLWACANTGRGAIFHFTLPTAACASATPAA